MTGKKANVFGWALIAAIAAVCFVLNAMRAQYIYYNGFIIFTLVAAAVLVLAHVYLARKVQSDPELPHDSGQPTNQANE